ncbi:MAG: hypothetical protein SAJ12_02255 [Jaaginema sp. PMC 1079.18]|nr:hypothetical protein [Jaaginema sp. PMC 1080.18]MEC4849811.1 hypothetical protein [Jaaginema sp. PMC 1079.18]MEC4866893.1 hypothetical protein [Jaaginema sp. PMC 1078.18]
MPTQQPSPSFPGNWTQGVQQAIHWGDRALDLIFMVLAEVEENLD